MRTDPDPASRNTHAPPQVLYSDFVTLLDGGRVRAARLEAGTSRLFFDIHLPTPQQQAAAAAAAAASAAMPQPAAAPAAAAAAAPAAPAAVMPALAAAATASTAAAAPVLTPATAPAAAAAASTSEAAGPAPAAAAAASSSAASAPVRQRFQRQFYIKLADKYDPLLIMRLIQVTWAKRGHCRQDCGYGGVQRVQPSHGE